VDRKQRLALEKETSKDIRIMTLEAELDGLRRKLATLETSKVTASAKPVYENRDALTDYLIEKFEDGSIAHENVTDIADLLDVSLTKRVGLSVDVRVTFEAEVPFDALKDAVVSSLVFSATSADYPAISKVGTKVLDWNNEKIV
jgi:hypothetical protein